MKIIYFLSRLFAYIATGVLGLMMLLTVADVFFRWVFNSPITGTTEITEFMLVIVVFPALAWCALTGKHIKVDLIMSRFSQRVQTIVDTITLLAALGTFTIITWRSALESMEVDSASSLIQVPHRPFYWVLTIGFALFCLSILTLVVENIMKEVKR